MLASICATCGWCRIQISLLTIPPGMYLSRKSLSKLLRIWVSSRTQRRSKRKGTGLGSGRLEPPCGRTGSTRNGHLKMLPFTDRCRISHVVGCFGRLMICLPAAHIGGKLLLAYGGEVKDFSTETSSSWGYSYIAW